VCHSGGGSGKNDPIYQADQYNPYNKWNTTHGLMHLTHPCNTLQAEITLGADATVLWSFEHRVVAGARHPHRPLATAERIDAATRRSERASITSPPPVTVSRWPIPSGSTCIIWI
jgi:hypothetical protein